MARRSKGAPVQPEVDDDEPDDKPPAPIAGGHDVDHAMRLLEWGRRRGYLLGPNVRVGSVVIQVRDLQLMKRQAIRDDSSDAAPSDIFKEHGMTDDDEPFEGTM